MSTHFNLPVQRQRFWAFAIPLAIALSSWATLALADGWPTRPYYYFVHWVAMGQQDAALAQFADDAVVVAGPLCTAQLPCVGKAEIRARYIAPLQARPDRLPVADARFDGRVLRAFGDLPREPWVRARGQRRAGEHQFEFRDGRISAVRVEPDERDAKAAAAATLVESQAASAATASR